MITFLVKNNNEKDVADSFLVAVPPTKAGNLAIVEAKSAKDGTKLNAFQVTLPEAEDGAAVFRIMLAQPLSPGGKARVEVLVAFTHTLSPLPREIIQKESQFVEYRDSTHIYSPHRIETQGTTVTLASREVEAYLPRADAKKKGDLITYGPYEVSEPWTLGEELYIHSENNSPFATLRQLDKEIEISQWGNIAVTENSLVEHTGAKLKGGFSRSAYQSYREDLMGRSSFRSLFARIPSTAKEIYYRDAIGNISTSNIRRDREGLILELQPRYPMFGGWKADIEFGYNTPAHTWLSTDKNDNEQFILDVPFSTAFTRVSVDELTVRVVLPEGATNIRWSTPFDIDAVGHETRVTYLDSTGRPVLVLKKRNVVGQHQQKFTVAYTFPRVNLYREPGLIIIALFTFLLLTMVYVRLDFSFDQTSSGEATKVKTI